MARVAAVNDRHERELGEIDAGIAFAKMGRRRVAALNEKIADLPEYNFGVRDRVVIVRVEQSEADRVGHEPGLYTSECPVSEAESLVAGK